MTYRECVKTLMSGGVEDARYDASVIFCKLFGMEMASIPLIMDKEFESEELSLWVSRRVAGEPLQYIIGEWEFYGLPFEVNENCLCPRGDTELLVELAIKHLPKGADFLELCTGSGCIPVSLCKNRQDVKGKATDLFPETLEIAKRNAERNGVSDKIDFVLSDVFGVDRWKEYKFDAIISNPPYIPTKDIEDLSKEVKREPRAALDGGEDGLDFYRVIIGQYGKYLKENGIMLLEIGYDQGDALKELAKEAGYACEIYKDLGGNDRVIIIKDI